MKKILDACCGSRMFWFDRQNPDVIFADNREVETTLCDGRSLLVKPDVHMDFRNMPYPDNNFKIVVFDPPYPNIIMAIIIRSGVQVILSVPQVELISMSLRNI